MKVVTATILSAALVSSTAVFAGNGHMSSMDHMNQMQTHMQQMKMEMAKIQQLKDSKARHARMQKHLENMSSMMKTMHEKNPKMSGEDVGMHMKMLEKRLDLLQDMMTQVVEVQTVTFPAILEPTD